MKCLHLTLTALAHVPDWAESIERAMALYAKWARESPRHRVPRAGAQAAKDVSRAFAHLAQKGCPKVPPVRPELRERAPDRPHTP